MGAPGKVFISHTHANGDRFAALLTLLRSWGVDLWYDEREPHAGEQLSERTQMAMAESGVLLRLCTAATRHSYWMSLETGAFLGLQAEDYRQGLADQRRIVNLIADAAYVPEPFDRATTVIDAVGEPAHAWVGQLRAALGLPPLPLGDAPAVDITPRRQPVPRRTVLALGAGGAALAAVTAAGALCVRAGGRLPGVGSDCTTARPGATAAPAATPPAVKDAHLKWFYQTGDKITSSPVVAGGLVFIGSQDGKLYALDPATGKQVWNDDFDAHVLTPPTVVGNVLYLWVFSDLFALDLATGKKIWRDDGAAFTAPAVAGEYVYTGYIGSGEPGGVYAFTTASGKYVWSAPISGNADEVAVVGTTVYAGGDDGALFAFDASNISAPLDPAGDANKGTTLWTFKAADEIHGLSVVDGTIYCGSFDHHLYALDAGGTLRWKFATGNKNWSTPAVADGLVYFGSGDGAVYALDQGSGQQVWTYKTGGPVYRSSPTLANGLLYIASQDKSVYGLDPHTGKLAQQFKTADEINSTPAYANGLVYIGCTDGYCYAFNAAR